MNKTQTRPMPSVAVFYGVIENRIPGKLEWFEGRLREVKDPRRSGWWRFNKHYDRDGYCDNPARGY